MVRMRVRQSKEEPPVYLNQYWRYASVLKNWFIGYGIGMLLLFINKPDFFISIPQEKRIAIFIWVLAAVFSQVLIALVNKITQYYVYRGAVDSKTKTRFYYKWSYKISCWFWIDLLADLITLVAYAWATIQIIINIVASTNGAIPT